MAANGPRVSAAPPRSIRQKIGKILEQCFLLGIAGHVPHELIERAVQQGVASERNLDRWRKSKLDGRGPEDARQETVDRLDLKEGELAQDRLDQSLRTRLDRRRVRRHDLLKGLDRLLIAESGAFERFEDASPHLRRRIVRERDGEDVPQAVIRHARRKEKLEQLLRQGMRLPRAGRRRDDREARKPQGRIGRKKENSEDCRLLIVDWFILQKNSRTCESFCDAILGHGEERQSREGKERDPASRGMRDGVADQFGCRCCLRSSSSFGS